MRANSDMAAGSAAQNGWTELMRTQRVWVSVASHLVLFALSWFLAFCLAYNFRFTQPVWFLDLFLPMLPLVVVVKLVIFHVRGLFHAWWRYVGLRDLFAVTQASWICFLLIWAVYYATMNAYLLGIGPMPSAGQDFPDSVFLLDFAGTIALVCGARVAVRLYHEEIRPEGESNLPRLLILGAGDCGANVVREILRMPLLRYRVVGFLDDDTSKHRARIHGVEVLGPIADIKQLAEDRSVDEILIAMPSATKAQIRRVVELCQGTNIRFKTVPAMADLIAGKVSVSQFRNVEINDLLGRAPVALDATDIRAFISTRVVMVTGAGGSIGSEMCRQIASFGPQRLVLVERAEQHLFEIEQELRRSFPALNVVPCLCDIADARRVDQLFAAERPAAVYHAAAHKHVPMMEYNPGEAIKNNVAGTRVIADAAARHGCEKFVMVSTDKAVNPTSIMGASKRVAEMYIQGLDQRCDTQFVTVRFGNVLGSSGSVIPIFKEQIARGGPVTVTHPDMVRYFMTIPEAAQLVLQAGFMGRGGEIFVLDMGDPVKIVDLARDLITLSGFRPGEDIEIVFSGMRPGEKLYEELSIEGEDVSRTAHPKIGIWKNRPEEWEPLVRAIDDLVASADELARDEARRRLRQIVPEFQLETPPALQTAGTARPTPAGEATLAKIATA
ncbi:MAG: UDP-N-acetyl-alpha-D-glucosamine C6 dehydratase [Phycisphaerae bacterium]|nr:UDP-N-acetyl-alpha-D-glucosamine C6 dehydratase [Phycisphaerae bacterium]